MKRFLPLLVPIVILLISIPVLLNMQYILLAKIAGIASVILTSIALRIWLTRSDKIRTRLMRVKLTTNEKYFLENSVSIYKVSNKAIQKSIDERIGTFLAELDFDRYDRTAVGKDECVTFACALSFATSDLTYSSLKGKIVVFREGESPEIQYQNQYPVLFIDESVLLKELNNPEFAESPAESPNQITRILREFYRI